MRKAHLVPCASCARHVRVTENACPFCGASLSSELRATPAPVPPRTRLSRAGLVALGASVAGAALSVACSGSIAQQDASTGGGTEGGVVSDAADADADALTNADAYGMPPRDAGDADVIMNGTKYGGPPLYDGGYDTGSDGFATLYGGPTPRDPRDGGTD